jgi:hypothetical protein
MVVAGTASSISGSSVTYAGGGGGVTNSSGSGGSGGGGGGWKWLMPSRHGWNCKYWWWRRLAVETLPVLVRLAALALLLFLTNMLDTQAQPQAHQQLQPAVQTQF